MNWIVPESFAKDSLAGNGQDLCNVNVEIQGFLVCQLMFVLPFQKLSDLLHTLACLRVGSSNRAKGVPNIAGLMGLLLEESFGKKVASRRVV